MRIVLLVNGSLVPEGTGAGRGGGAGEGGAPDVTPGIYTAL
jgi:hypothetical protein